MVQLAQSLRGSRSLRRSTRSACLVIISPTITPYESFLLDLSACAVVIHCEEALYIGLSSVYTFTFKQAGPVTEKWEIDQSVVLISFIHS